MTDTQQTPTRPQGEARTQMRKCGLFLFHSGIFMKLCTVTAVCCFYSSPPCPPPPFSLLQPIVAIANMLHLNMAFYASDVKISTLYSKMRDSGYQYENNSTLV